MINDFWGEQTKLNIDLFIQKICINLNICTLWWLSAIKQDQLFKWQKSKPKIRRLALMKVFDNAKCVNFTAGNFFFLSRAVLCYYLYALFALAIYCNTVMHCIQRDGKKNVFLKQKDE